MPNTKWLVTEQRLNWYQNRTDHWGWYPDKLWNFLIEKLALTPESTVALAKFLRENEAGFIIATEGHGWHIRRMEE